LHLIGVIEVASRVGVIAVAQTKYSDLRQDVGFGELAYEVVHQVLEETGLRFTEDGTGIDATVTSSHDQWSGRTISQLDVEDVVGGHYGTEEKVVGDGAQAVAYGAMQILGGDHSCVLVMSYCMESITEGPIIENIGFDPLYQRLLGLDFVSAGALQAQRYMHRFGITTEELAKVVVKNRGNAANNPYAQEPLELTVEDVLKSRMLAYPLRELDAKPISDGAVALVLASEERAGKLTDRPVWITGIGSCYEAHYLGNRDLADCDALTAAAKRAYKMAKIADPVKELDLAEISEHYSYQELLWSEGLGFCEKGEGGSLINRGLTEMRGELPINASGGVLSGVPATVAGATRVAEAVLQLRGEAGSHQVERATVALAHGTTGACGQHHCVLILGK
jgi:acetyl-CoA C-acetyltransferase